MTVRFKGKSLEIGGKMYVFPPLSLGSIESHGDNLVKLGNVSIIEQAKIAIDVAFDSLRRNYPEIKREEVADMIDLGNFQEVINTVMLVSEMTTAKKDGEESGE